MQTFANLSGSREVLKQIEINKESLARLREYFDEYKPLAKYQMELNYQESEKAKLEKKKLASMSPPSPVAEKDMTNYMGSSVAFVDNSLPKPNLNPQNKIAMMSKRRYAANMSFLDR